MLPKPIWPSFPHTKGAYLEPRCVYGACLNLAGGRCDASRRGVQQPEQAGELERALGLIGRIGSAGDYCSPERGLALLHGVSLLLHASGV